MFDFVKYCVIDIVHSVLIGMQKVLTDKLWDIGGTYSLKVLHTSYKNLQYKVHSTELVRSPGHIDTIDFSALNRWERQDSVHNISLIKWVPWCIGPCLWFPMLLCTLLLPIDGWWTLTRCRKIVVSWKSEDYIGRLSKIMEVNGIDVIQNHSGRKIKQKYNLFIYFANNTPIILVDNDNDCVTRWKYMPLNPMSLFCKWIGSEPKSRIQTFHPALLFTKR